MSTCKSVLDQLFRTDRQKLYMQNDDWKNKMWKASIFIPDAWIHHFDYFDKIDLSLLHTCSSAHNTYLLSLDVLDSNERCLVIESNDVHGMYCTYHVKWNEILTWRYWRMPLNLIILTVEYCRIEIKIQSNIRRYHLQILFLFLF